MSWDQQEKIYKCIRAISDLEIDLAYYEKMADRTRECLDQVREELAELEADEEIGG
jgi:hypothetical protein